MSDVNISGVFSLESKNQKVSKKNMVVLSGIQQIFRWFKASSKIKQPKHISGEKLFSKNAVERIYLSFGEDDVTVMGGTNDDTTNKNIVNSFSGVGNIVDGWDNTVCTSTFESSGDYQRIIKVSFPEALDLRAIALYGKKPSGYSYTTDYPGEITLVRNFIINEGEEDEITIVAKKTFKTPDLLSPYDYNGNLNFDESSNNWAGRENYVYFTFDEEEKEKNWLFYKNGELITEIPEDIKNFQKSITKEKPYLRNICGLEIMDRYYAKIQINELDIYTYRPEYFYNAPLYFKVGKNNDETALNAETLNQPIEEKIAIEDVYVTNEGKIRYSGYITPETFVDAEIGEVGIFFMQDGVEKIFARTALDEMFVIPENSFVRIVYDLEVN